MVGGDEHRVVRRTRGRVGVEVVALPAGSETPDPDLPDVPVAGAVEADADGGRATAKPSSPKPPSREEDSGLTVITMPLVPFVQVIIVEAFQVLAPAKMSPAKPRPKSLIGFVIVQLSESEAFRRGTFSVPPEAGMAA
jgi:hypothetical protein